MNSLILILMALTAITGKETAPAVLLQPQLQKVMSEGYLDARIEEGALINGNLFKIKHVKVNKIKSWGSHSLSHYEGQPASRNITDKIISELKDKLLSTGFIFSSIEFDLETSLESERVNLLLTIKTGSRFKLGKLVFRGTKTREKTLQRLSLLQPGETYDYRRIQKAIRKLSRKGYFSDVYQEALARDSLKNLVYPILNISDLKANQISGVLGYNNDNESRDGSALNGFIDIQLVNLIGTARDLEFNFASQNKEKQIHFEFTEPWLWTLPVGASLNLSRLIEDSIYIESSYGTTLFQDINFNSHYNLSFLRQFNETFFFVDSFTGLKDTLIFSSQKTNAVISGIEIIQDWRDKVPGTLMGGYLKTKFNGIRRNQADSVTYLLQNLTESHSWIPLGKRIILKIKAAMAISLPLETSLNNRGNLFQVGGANTLRGYREKEFLTNAYVYSNLELQYLLSKENRILILVDPGWVNKSVGEFDWNKVLGYGVGMDLGSADWVFAIRYALNPERSFGGGLIQVKIENRF